MSALPCRRRSGRRPRPGHIIVFRPDLPARIEWRCNSCGDEGVISGREGTYSDLRARRPEGPEGGTLEVIVSDKVAAALRDLRLLDPERERLVCRARAVEGGAVLLIADGNEFDELIGFVADGGSRRSV